MSGHSKWSKVKHQKAFTDAVKGQLFTKATRAIAIAVKEGSGITDPNGNFRLRLAIEKAKAVNMPKDSIEKAIARAKGTDDAIIEEVVFEGYGPSGVAILAVGATDNKKRIVAQVQYIFDRHGFSFASPGAVLYLFQKRGIITVGKGALSFDTILSYALEASADDIEEKADVYEIFVEVSLLQQALDSFLEKGVIIDNASIIFHPHTTVQMYDIDKKRIEKFMSTLGNVEDIIEIYTNSIV